MKLLKKRAKVCLLVKQWKTKGGFGCGSENHFADKCSLKDSGITWDTGQNTKECFEKRNDENRRRKENNDINYGRHVDMV